MKNESKKNYGDTQLKEENPVKYYLKHIGDKQIMETLRWEDIELYNFVQRLHYVQSFQTREPLNKCPKCEEPIEEDEWGEEYCSKCGLVTRSHYPYVASQKIIFPYGIKL